MFATTSQVSRKFSLSDGVAFGKVQLSFVFRSVYLDLPRTLRGAEVATVEILGPISLKFPPSDKVRARGGYAGVERACRGDYLAWENALVGSKLIFTVGRITHQLTMYQYDPKGAEARSYLAQYTHLTHSSPSKAGAEGAQGPEGVEKLPSDHDAREDRPISLLTIPLLDRYLTPLILGVNPHVGISTLSARRKCDAYASQWLGDIPDCLPEDTPGGAVGGPLEMEQQRSQAPVTWVTIPVVAGPEADIVVGNYIGPEAAATHGYGVVGEMRLGLRIHPGYDLCHDTMMQGTTKRHEFETYNRLRGMPKQAEVNSHAADDGIIDRHERAAIRRAKREALHARHRGAYGYPVIRTVAWARDSLKSRLEDARTRIAGSTTQHQTVMSEV